jgi:hypothetical protein
MPEKIQRVGCTTVERIVARLGTPTQCPGELFLCPNGSFLCPVKATLCPSAVILCPGSLFLCPSDSVLCPGSLFLYPGDSFLCPGSLFLCPGDSLLCPEHLFLCPNESAERRLPGAQSSGGGFCRTGVVDAGPGGSKVGLMPMACPIARVVEDGRLSAGHSASCQRVGEWVIVLDSG